MKTLPYQSPHASRSLRPSLILILPLASGLATFVAVLHSALQEPFGYFFFHDAVIQFGSPLIAAALWGWWIVIARQERFSRAAFGIFLAWATLQLAISVLFIVGYLHEPWVAQ